MKYVYTNKELNRFIPDNVRVRWLVGLIFGFVSTIMLLCTFTAESIGGRLSFYAARVILGGIGFLFIFFAMRTKRAIVRATNRTPEDVIVSDASNPFYSSQCPNCAVMIDYQRADLAFRLWFIRGYVECPCCCKPIRHNSQKNVFIPHRYPKEHEEQ